MSFPLGTGLDYDHGDSVKALCIFTDWIDKPTDIPSKITELQDFLLLYLNFDFFFLSVEWGKTDTQYAMSKYDLHLKKEMVQHHLNSLVSIQSCGKLYSMKVARAVWREIPD